MGSPMDHGFRRTSDGRWRGTLPDGSDVVLKVDRTPGDRWRAEAVIYGPFGGRDTEHVATTASSALAEAALADWAREHKGPSREVSGL